MALAQFLAVLIGALPLLIPPGAEAGEVGVSYGRVMSPQLDPSKVVQLLKQNGITMVRLYDADPEVLKAFANTGIKVMVMLPNEEIAAAAASRSHALQWAQCNVSDHYPATLINGVAIGNEVFHMRPDLTRQLVPAMTNVQAALAKLGLADKIKVSSPLSFTAFTDTFPPSSARFKDDIAQSVMVPMLQFLKRTGSYLSVNPYPFFAYAEDPDHIPLSYALGNYEKGVRDNNTGLVYHSLLDAMMDATHFAMENLTKGSRKVMQSIGTADADDSGLLDTKLTETGHPSQGQLKPGKNRKASRRLNSGNGFHPATVDNAKAYNNYVINRVLSGNTGTPRRPNADLDVYIFALFKENMKGQGPDDIEQYFGLFCPQTMSKVYEFDFHGGGGGGLRASWCVANTDVGDERLQAALEWACSNGADCSDIQPGATCFEPNTKAAHASHAFNSFYQHYHRAGGSCDFAGAASIVYEKPKIGNCMLPSSA